MSETAATTSASGTAAGALELRGVIAGYKGTDVLRGIDLTVEPGQIVGVLGANGAGKSTLLKTISGQVRLREGSRTIAGTDATNWRPNKVARGGIRWLGDPRPIYRSMTVEENLQIGASIIPGRFGVNRDRVFDLMPMLRDKRTERGGSLSGGQQQMLAIGQALMSEPTFLCLDEPSLGLAPTVINDLSVLIGELAASGVGIVWAEQFPEVALRRSSHVIVIGAGRVVLSGTPDTVTREAIESAYLGGH